MFNAKQRKRDAVADLVASNAPKFIDSSEPSISRCQIHRAQIVKNVIKTMHTAYIGF